MKLPRETGPIHFIGIGGIGMSGIAEVMKTLGYAVQGSDLADNYNVARLRKLGIPVEIGHREENLRARVVVILGGQGGQSRARRRPRPPAADRPARRDAGRVMRFKSCVAVGGTHGKTTTTCWLPPSSMAAVSTRR